MSFKSINLENFIKEKGLKITKARASILEVFILNKKPLNAEDIYKRVLKNKENKNLNEATVYRTISSFEKAGILRQVNLRRDSVYFELDNDHHHHLVCVKCGDIEDFRENNEIEKILGRIVEKSSRFKIINEHSLEIFGICKGCDFAK